MTPLVLEIAGRTKPGRREDLLRLFETHLAPRAALNDSQVLVVWAADEADGDRFVLFEIYRDRAAAEANSRASWFAAYMAEAGPLLAEMPAMMSAVPRWCKGVPG
jgi:quinol monooxygenase YgiN